MAPRGEPAAVLDLRWSHPRVSPDFFDRATDPWVSFSADGKIAYLISDSFNANGPAFGGASSIIVSRSTDGGVTWQAPVTARVDASTTVLNDKETVTADPIAPNTAYAIWDRLVSPSQNANPGAFNHSPAFRGPTLFSRTTDGGVTWSNGRVIYDPGEKNQTIGNQIVVPAAGPAKGVLIDGFDLILTKGGKGNNQRATFSVAVIRSTDGGATWSKPIIVAQQNVGTVSIAGHTVRTSDVLPEFAVGPEGNLYAVWQDSELQRGRHLEDRVLGVDRRWPPLDHPDPDRPVAGRHPRLHAADARRRGRNRRRRLLRPRKRHDGTAGADGHVHRPLPRRCVHNAASWTANGETKAQHHGPLRHDRRTRRRQATSSATTTG